MTLCRGLSLDRRLILELQNSFRALSKRAVSNNEELVVPRLTGANFLFNGVTIIVGSTPIALLTMYDNCGLVGYDIDRIGLIKRCTLNKLKHHIVVLGVNLNLPNAKAGKIEFSICRRSILNPLVGENLALRLQGCALEGGIVATGGRDHHLRNVSGSVASYTNGGLKIFFSILGKLNSIVQIIIRRGGFGVDTRNEVTLVELQILPGEVVEIEVVGRAAISFIRVQVECQRPSISCIVIEGELFIKGLPLCGEIDIANSLVEKIVRRMLFVNLGTCRACYISLIAELDLNLCTRFPTLRRLNPELVCPCNRICIAFINGINLCDMNYENMVRFISCFCFDVSGERTCSGTIRINNALLEILTHGQRPCADFSSTVTTPVDVNAISLLKRPCRPCCFSITIGNSLKPLLRSLVGLQLVIDDEALPFDGSS